MELPAMVAMAVSPSSSTSSQEEAEAVVVGKTEAMTVLPVVVAVQVKMKVVPVYPVEAQTDREQVTKAGTQDNSWVLVVVVQAPLADGVE